MAGISHNAQQVAARLEAKGAAAVQRVTGELDRQAQLMARVMQREAPQSFGTLRNSIHVEKPSPYVRVIAPGVDYGTFVHGGRKPGKGLPRFFDPAAKPLVDWLESHLGGGPKRKGERQSHELALRDIYMGWSWKVKQRGIEANPFAKRAFDQRVVETAAALRLAVQQALQTGGATA
jgi:hypothetical protein